MTKSIVLRPRLVIDAEAHPRLFAALNSRTEQERAVYLTIAAEEGVRVLQMRSAGELEIAAQPPRKAEAAPAVTAVAAPAETASTEANTAVAPAREFNAFLPPGADLLGALAAFKNT